MNNGNKQETEDKPRWTRAVSRKEAVPDRFGKKELEAIIEDTENAANRILDAADRIVASVGDAPEEQWADAPSRNALREQIKNDIQEILLACSFQDRTGQRIRNTLNNLHAIEDRINGAFEKLGIEVKPDAKAIEERLGKASSQDDIDSLFS